MLKKTILWVLVLICATSIFLFSSQPASESKKTSISITEKIINISPEIRKLTPEEKQPIINSLQETVRKFAHFTLFLILGVLILYLLFCYEFNFKKAWYSALLICLLYAISDESHQLFVAGRGCQWQDVLIDFCGSFIGSGILIIIRKKLLTMKLKSR